MSIKGEGGSDALMEKSILNFYFDYFHPSLSQHPCQPDLDERLSGIFFISYQD